MQNAAKINKDMGEIFVTQYYERLKELFDFNKLAKFILSDYFHNEVFVLANIRKCIILHFTQFLRYEETQELMS